MPENHEKFPYIQKLVEEKNVKALKEEAKYIQRILNDYTELLPKALTKEDEINVLENIKHEEKLLNYINSALEKILSSN